MSALVGWLQVVYLDGRRWTEDKGFALEDGEDLEHGVRRAWKEHAVAGGLGTVVRVELVLGGKRVVWMGPGTEVKVG